MIDFKQWCEANNLSEVVYGKKAPMEAGKKANHEEEINGGRDGRKDLSADYKGNMARNGTVAPFELKKGHKKATPKSRK